MLWLGRELGLLVVALVRRHDVRRKSRERHTGRSAMRRRLHASLKAKNRNGGLRVTIAATGLVNYAISDR